MRHPYLIATVAVTSLALAGGAIAAASAPTPSPALLAAVNAPSRTPANLARDATATPPRRSAFSG